MLQEDSRATTPAASSKTRALFIVRYLFVKNVNIHQKL